MTTGAAPEFALKSVHEASLRRESRRERMISGCCRAILAHFSIDPENMWRSASNEAFRDELRIGEISRSADYLAMTLFLPMPYGAAHMTISTIGSARLMLPGMSLSPKIAAASVGQAIGRLTGHPAFAELDHILVTSVETGHDGQGRPATILHFEDPAEPLRGVRPRAPSRSIH